MSRSLAPLLFALALLSGCAMTPAPTPEAVKPDPRLADYAALQQWLNQQQHVAALGTEAVVAELVSLQRPEGTAELYYFGLLNQRLQTYASWTQARDTFRQLQQNEKLTVEQKQLADILREYNQNRINWYQRQAELLKRQAVIQQELQDAEQEKLQLEQKIQALTDLEAVISTRKEQ